MGALGVGCTQRLGFRSGYNWRRSPSHKGNGGGRGCQESSGIRCRCNRVRGRRCGRPRTCGANSRLNCPLLRLRPSPARRTGLHDVRDRSRHGDWDTRQDRRLRRALAVGSTSLPKRILGEAQREGPHENCQQFANKFTVDLTKKKLGQFVPVAGMVVGAGLNFAFIDRIAAAANDAYRERFLVEKSGGTLSGVAEGAGSPISLDEGTISVIELLEEEDALPPLDPDDTSSADGRGLTPPNTAVVPQEIRHEPTCRSSA